MKQNFYCKFNTIFQPGSFVSIKLYAVTTIKMMKTLKAWIAICLSIPLLLLSETSKGQAGAENLSIAAHGTGRTTGHIATLTVTNNGNFSVAVEGQMVYIPSDGKYQSYIGRIPDGIAIPPGGTADIPVDGYCADVHRPPVPAGESMSSSDDWIPVIAPTSPEPINPRGVSDQPSVPEPSNPPGSNTPPYEGTPVSLFPESGAPPNVTPEAWSDTPAFKPGGLPSPETIVKWPRTDLHIDGTINPSREPRMYGYVLADVITQIESAVDVIQHEPVVTTPFANDPIREREAIIQQTFWIWTSAVTGEEYTDDDFTERVYAQYETSTGSPVTTLPEEQKEQVDSGIIDFWNTFQATGVEAKIISAESSGIDIGNQVMATVSGSQACRCKGISYDLEVKHGGDVVHSDSHTSRNNPRVRIVNFKYGDELEIKITNINPDCQCDGAECDHFPAESQNPNSPKYTNTDTSRTGQVDIEMDNDPVGEIGSKGNNNCQHKDASWNAATDEYSFTLETRDENTNAREVFQRLRIKAYCQLDDCRRTLCAKIIQLNFVTAR